MHWRYAIKAVKYYHLLAIVLIKSISVVTGLTRSKLIIWPDQIPTRHIYSYVNDDEDRHPY